MHEALLGADYPLFAASLADVAAAAAAAAAEPGLYRLAADRTGPRRRAVHPGPGGGAAARLPGRSGAVPPSAAYRRPRRPERLTNRAAPAG